MGSSLSCCWFSEVALLVSLPHLRIILSLVLLNRNIPCLANSVDPDRLASEEAS